MITIDIAQFPNWIKNNWSKIAVVILLLLLAFQCNSNIDLKTATNDLKIQANQNLTNAKLFEQKYNALVENDAKYIDSIKVLKDKEKVLIAERKVIYIATQGKIAEVRKFKSAEIAKYIQKRYKTDSTEVKTEKFGTCVNDTIAKGILVELQEKDGCYEIVDNLSREIANKEKIEKQKDGLLSNSKEKELNLLSAIDNYKSANELKDNALKNTETMLKHEKIKKNLWKIVSVAILTGSTYLLITK